MPRCPWAVVALATALVAGAATDARADFNLTGFVGASTTPAVRPVKGVAAGVGLLVVGFEFEYVMISEDVTAEMPSLKTGMVNVLAQTPIPLGRVQVYGTIGGGVYHEVLGDRGQVNVGINYGGGVRLTIAGPLRAHFDYRLFQLYGSAHVPNPQRFYAGLSLSF